LTEIDDFGRKSGLFYQFQERCHVRQDLDAFVLRAVEGNSFSEHEGTFFLLPYYMGLYYGLIE